MHDIYLLPIKVYFPCFGMNIVLGVKQLMSKWDAKWLGVLFLSKLLTHSSMLRVSGAVNRFKKMFQSIYTYFRPALHVWNYLSEISCFLWSLNSFYHVKTYFFLNKTNTSFSEVLHVTKYLYKGINASVKPWNEDSEWVSEWVSEWAEFNVPPTQKGYTEPPWTSVWSHIRMTGDRGSRTRDPLVRSQTRYN